MKLQPPENCTSCSWDGVEYEAGTDGLVEVPDEALDLLHHGFKVPAPKEEKPKGKKE